MRFDLKGSALVALLAVGSTLTSGCSDASFHEGTEASTDAIVDVDHSRVKRQAIGNCWLYATASWAESLAKSASGDELNMSESYWTYWHWFDQIANGRASTEITTGGRYATAVEIIARYGIVSEEAFIAAEVNEERSLRQKSALAKVNESLKTGALSTPAARQNRALVRAELDAAFELPDEVVAQMNQVFGDGVTRTLDRSNVNTTGTPIKRASDIEALLRDPVTRQPYQGTLQDAIGTRSGAGNRTGRYAWQMTSYPWDVSSRRSTLARVQKAMHDRQPVIVSWYVDFNAMNASGQFLAPPATPGSQGGHMVVVEDYQINDVPGFGTLKAGVAETRPEALQAALSPTAKIEFIRIKNSWGSHRPDPLLIGAGYHDLYMQSLDGPIQQCSQENGVSTDDCYPDTPLNDFVLPPGY